jgi:hypothetical protein
MRLLKPKLEKSTTIGVRLPVSIKNKLNELRVKADAKGFDFTGSLTEAIVRWSKQVEEELGGASKQNGHDSTFTQPEARR